jgi:hypothetical protein
VDDHEHEDEDEDAWWGLGAPTSGGIHSILWLGSILGPQIDLIEW